MLYICVDNEGYMNTGFKGRAPRPTEHDLHDAGGTSAPRQDTGRQVHALIMVMHNCEYVATASTSFMEDYYAKLDKAAEAAKKGMAYIHVFSPARRAGGTRQAS